MKQLVSAGADTVDGYGGLAIERCRQNAPMSRRPTKKGNGGDGESSSPVAQARQGDAGNEDDVSTGVWRALRSSAAAAAAVNVVGFTITAISRTHKITDLCGTAGFVVSAAATLTMRNAKGVHGKPALAWLLAAAVAMWAIRLGTFLLVRVLRVGSDWRLEPFCKQRAPRAAVQGRCLTLPCFAGRRTAQSLT